MENKRIIEAILFSSTDPIKVSDLTSITGIGEDEIRKILSELIEEYQTRNSSIEIVSFGGKYLMRVKPRYSKFIEKFVEREFDKGTLRTLAVIAVKQPITLSKLAKIRGNKCYDHVKKLKKMGFIKTEKKGRSTILTTTKEFATYFGFEGNDPNKIKEVLRKHYDEI
ncbi:SMC-Scp complex subunit ScpB [Archaeoglobales archaeon]|nr:MAG: SMC-Scp complex subunit ScpB [Archaeoglobales archaeon]